MPWGAAILALLLFIPLHELVHAVVHPSLELSPRTIVVLWPAKLRSVVLASSPKPSVLSRTRLIVLEAARGSRKAIANRCIKRDFD